MSAEELRQERDTREMTGDEFGAFLAKALGRRRAYDRREVSAWESGARPIPEAVERVLLRLRLDP
jgi:hypothetical protein